MDSSQNHAASATISSNRQRLAVRVPPTDIASCIRVRLPQRLLTVVSILLVVSDVPRTGLTIGPKDYYDIVGPGIVMYWGPYEYHVGHLKIAENTSLNSTQSSIEASCDGTPIESLDLWSYKHDTLSIAPRAVVEHLNVTPYPPCVLYREPCQALTLEPRTVFDMLDALATAIQQQWFVQSNLPLMPFFTRSKWVDRLHHFLFRIFTSNPDVRLHALYHTSISNDIFGNNNRSRLHPSTPYSRRSFPMRISVPFIGANAVKWVCEHPVFPDGRRAIAISDHIEIRIQELGRRYPDLELDLTMFASSLIEKTKRGNHYVLTAAYSTDTIEVTTLVRGRRCDISRNCRTVFVDDYRYERSWIESDEGEWTLYVWLLRGSAQLYIWIRVATLLCGCVSAAKSEPHSRHGHFFARLLGACRILVRIPGHAFVYGSWYPLVMYVLAHIFDSSLVQAMGEFAWSSTGGLYDFNLIQYTVTASIQMRNIWMIVLLWKLSMPLLAACTRGRNASFDPARVGILSIRTGWIACVSWLTTFALMRAVRFRNTDVISVTELPRHIPLDSVRSRPDFLNFVDYGPQFDLKCVLIASVIATSAGWLAKAIVRIVSGRGTAVFMSRVHYFPLDAGRLWSWSVLNGVWPMKLGSHERVHATRIDTIRSVAEPESILPHNDATRTCAVCSFRSSTMHWRATQGCVLHEPIFDIARRTKAIWSTVRLTNIAAMTDPIVLFRLYIVGVPLYVYRVGSDHNEVPYLILLPTPPKTDATTTKRRVGWTTDVAGSIEYVATVNSRDVPWHVLINCG